MFKRRWHALLRMGNVINHNDGKRPAGCSFRIENIEIENTPWKIHSIVATDPF